MDQDKRKLVAGLIVAVGIFVMLLLASFGSEISDKDGRTNGRTLEPSEVLESDN